MERGKIISSQVAEQQFGITSKVIEFNSAKLLDLLKSTENYFMVAFKDDSLVFADNKRNTLSPEKENIDSSLIMMTYDVNKLEELIKLGKEASTKFELRKNNLLTISNGNFTLEYGYPCPPNCN